MKRTKRNTRTIGTTERARTNDGLSLRFGGYRTFLHVCMFTLGAGHTNLTHGGECRRWSGSEERMTGMEHKHTIPTYALEAQPRPGARETRMRPPRAENPMRNERGEQA